MKATITIQKEVELSIINVQAKVRYWEDATVNGVEDAEGELIPCRIDDNWCPVIHIDTGVITNWEIGKTASLHYKVCDCCKYQIFAIDGNEVFSDDDYVPDFLCPKGQGYGDYIIMDIDADGKIDNWHFNFEEVYNSEE